MLVLSTPTDNRRNQEVWNDARSYRPPPILDSRRNNQSWTNPLTNKTMKITCNHSFGAGRTRDSGGDSENLSDQIFAATGVQSKVFLKNGTVKLTIKSDADWYVARSFLIERG